jgi:hypothetical protein
VFVTGEGRQLERDPVAKEITNGLEKEQTTFALNLYRRFFLDFQSASINTIKLRNIFDISFK